MNLLCFLKSLRALWIKVCRLSSFIDSQHLTSVSVFQLLTTSRSISYILTITNTRSSPFSECREATGSWFPLYKTCPAI